VYSGSWYFDCTFGLQIFGGMSIRHTREAFRTGKTDAPFASKTSHDDGTGGIGPDGAGGNVGTFKMVASAEPSFVGALGRTN
jgi:hypothetical protein